jgi:hypothetical protein
MTNKTPYKDYTYKCPHCDFKTNSKVVYTDHLPKHRLFRSKR